MNKLLLTVFGGCFSLSLTAQPIITKWNLNSNGQKATYYAQTGSAQTPAYTFTTSPDSADVLKLCYTTDSVWIRCQGLTTNMGKYLNPGYCYAQNYTFRFPRNPQAASTTHTKSPTTGQIAMLLNGVPIYGIADANSWTGSTNAPNGMHVWNKEVGKAEGFVLDTAFGAHPQQAGAYHTHTTPYRLYKNTPTNKHSPLVGFAFDGYPIYGPYGYSIATDSNSAVTRMISGYALRNITTRTILPDGSTASQTGPAVNTTYPIGTYAEDYAWSASNGGTLDTYNGRYCITPDYPNGTYAYFVTVDATGKAVFPYYIGFYYYGVTDTKNHTTGASTVTSINFPAAATNCFYPITLPIKLKSFTGVATATGNAISWVVASNFNVKNFVLERSIDGINFTPISSISSKENNSSVAAYSYIDDVVSKTTYYRLLSVEKDGSETMSDILLINRKMKTAITVYPTIANSSIYIKANAVNLKGAVKIYDAVGKQISVEKIDIANGAVQMISTSNLTKGYYLLNIATTEHNEIVKFFKE